MGSASGHLKRAGCRTVEKGRLGNGRRLRRLASHIRLQRRSSGARLTEVAMPAPRHLGRRQNLTTTTGDVEVRRVDMGEPVVRGLVGVGEADDGTLHADDQGPMLKPKWIATSTPLLRTG